ERSCQTPRSWRREYGSDGGTARWGRSCIDHHQSLGRTVAARARDGGLCRGQSQRRDDRDRLNRRWPDVACCQSWQYRASGKHGLWGAAYDARHYLPSLPPTTLWAVPRRRDHDSPCAGGGSALPLSGVAWSVWPLPRPPGVAQSRGGAGSAAFARYSTRGPAGAWWMP